MNNAQVINPVKISVDSLGEDKLYVVEAEASRRGRRAAKAITVKLDSGAVGENWIEPRLVEELGLRTRDLEPREQRTYYNRLYEGQDGFKPAKAAVVSLWFKAWEFAVDVECCVFPDLKDQANYPKEEVVIGDRDCERFDLMRYVKKEIEPIQTMEVVPESEVIDDGLQDVDEVDRDRLNEGKFYHFGQLTENLGGVGEEWEA